VSTNNHRWLLAAYTPEIGYKVHRTYVCGDCGFFMGIESHDSDRRPDPNTVHARVESCDEFRVELVMRS
jgi:hypothetical protein